MRVQKDNIVIRTAISQDAVKLNKWWNDGRVMEHAGYPYGLGYSLEETIDDIKEWEGIKGQLCVIEIDGKVIGELSYTIKRNNVAYPGWQICEKSYQNKGYGPKIMMMLFEFIFTDEKINSKVPIKTIAWDTMIENKRAQYVYENKMGIRKVGIKKNYWKDQRGKWRTAIFYELNRNEFFNIIK